MPIDPLDALDHAGAIAEAKRYRALWDEAASEARYLSKRLSVRSVSTGRPCMLTDELADEIVERFSEGETAKIICEDLIGAPLPVTLRRWIKRYPEFGERVREAREMWERVTQKRDTRVIAGYA